MPARPPRAKTSKSTKSKKRRARRWPQSPHARPTWRAESLVWLTLLMATSPTR